MEPSGERKLSAVPSPLPEEDAAWRFLDAVWDVPVGLGLCDKGLRFIRVNEALAGFDGLSVDAHYEEGDVLARLPAAFAEGLREAAAGEAHDVEFASSGRCILVKLHPVLRPSDRKAIGVGIVAVDVTDERNAFRAVEEANRLVSDLLADATAKEQAKQQGKELGVYTVGVITCRPTKKEAEDYYHYSIVEHADWRAVDDILALKNITAQNTPPEKFQQIRTGYAQGMGGLPIVGDPDHVASQLIDLSKAGLTGVAVSLVNYLDELPFFCEEVLPRLQRAGLREQR